ncbi:MAG: HAD hydrolase-like protein [Candidatus Gottesmanbacteria bacterium]|nr:HAD hydrolase-like protein [Candidatus Gottesmanbacteria bacterium]
MKKNKLILFDIDGTLVQTTSNSVQHWKHRIGKVIKEVYGKEVDFQIETHRYNGGVDRNVLRSIARDAGVTDDTVFDAHFSKARQVFHDTLKASVESGEILYHAHPAALELVQLLYTKNDHALGLITGNIEINAWFKLDHAGMREYFSFGAFADDVNDRNELARHAVAKATKYFAQSFVPRDVVIIGDTIYDIRCGKHVGATTIGVATGMTHGHDDLVKEGADLVVDSLMDERVLTLLG